LDYAGRHAGTFFGKGLYFAESSTKADEYAKLDEDGCCCMLLCRTALGKMLVCDDLKPPKEILETCRANGYDSLLGDRLAAVGTYREFILFEANQVYPAFILRYKRWSEATLCRHIHDAVEEKDFEQAQTLFCHAAMLAEEHPDSSARYRLALLFSAHDATAVPILCRWLSDERRRVRLNCIMALMQLAVQHLDCSDAKSRYAKKHVPQVSCAVGPLIRCLKDSDRKVRVAAARTLERLGDYADAAADPLIIALEDLDAEMRAVAASALGNLGSSASLNVAALLQAAHDDDDGVRVAVVKALEQAGGKEPTKVVPVLEASLTDESAEVRSMAATSLGKLVVLRGPVHSCVVEVLPALTERLTDGEALVRSAAARSLGQVGQRITPAALAELVACLKDPEMLVRRTAVVALGQLGQNASTAVIPLTGALSDSMARVREAAAIALSRIVIQDKTGPASNLQTTFQVLIRRGLTDKSGDVRAAAASALAAMAQHGIHEDFVTSAMAIRLKDSDAKVWKAVKAYQNALDGSYSSDFAIDIFAKDMFPDDDDDDDDDDHLTG